MDKKEDFAERRARQKEKLRAQRAERRLASSTNAESALATPSNTPSLAKTDNAADSEGNDFVHVEKEDAAQADLGGVSTQAPLMAELNKSPVTPPAKHKAKIPASSPSAPKPVSKTEDGMQRLQLGSLEGAIKQQQGGPGSKASPAESSQASTAQTDAAGQALAAATHSIQQSRAGRSPTAAQPAQQPKGKRPPVGEVREPKPGSAGEALHATTATPSKTPVLQKQSAADKSIGALPDATASHNSASAASQQKQAQQASHDKSKRKIEGAGEPRDSGAATGAWGWGKGWLPTTALQQVAAGALKDVQEMKQSLQQAFAIEDSTTDEEEEAPPPKEAPSQESPESSQDAERRAVLERLQGQENPLAASFKMLDKRIDNVLGEAAGLAGSLLGRAHSAGRQVAGRVEAGLELFGQSAIRLLDGGMDGSKAPQITFASHFHQNGGADMAEDLEELCNISARSCNQLRSALKGAELDKFNNDVAGMATYLDTSQLTIPAADPKGIDLEGILRPPSAPDIDSLIVEATCRRGAERLKGLRNRKLDGFALWGLHYSACTELAEGVALCVEALHTFGIELSGRAAAKAGSLPADDAFSRIADYLRTKVLAMVGALSQLMDAYLALADSAAAKALAAFQAQQASSARSPAAPPQAAAATEQTSMSGEAEAASEQSRSAAAGTRPRQQKQRAGSGAAKASAEGVPALQRYPDHVHDPLKVQAELGNAKVAALQCVTELYRGLLYVVLYHCHGQRSL